MSPGSLIPNSPEVELICLRQKAGTIQVELRANQPCSPCPSCGRLSSRVHSRYWRTAADLPWEGIPVQILLRARKFFCVNERCSRRIFTEQLPGTVSRYARRSFGAAIAEGAPAATQVADRWHLLNNLFETLARSLERHRHLMREVRDLLEPQSELAVPHLVPEHALTEAQKRREQSRARRLERYEAMKALVDGGMNYSEASRHIGIPLRTVQRWVACGVFPERKDRKFPSNIDEFSEHLDRRYREGCRNATQLWREIKQLGFSGKACSVWYWLRKRFGFVRELSGLLPASRVLPVSPQHVAWLMLKARPSKHKYLQALYSASPQMASLARTARQFFEIIRTRDAAAWPRWLDEAQNSPLASFARRLKRDQAAVEAALRLPWSNGMVEGHIHRLKLLKRQMYGRAGFDLLKLRVLQPA